MPDFIPKHVADIPGLDEFTRGCLIAAEWLCPNSTNNQGDRDYEQLNGLAKKQLRSQ